MKCHRFPLLAVASLLLSLPILARDTKQTTPSEKMTPQTRILVIRDLTAEHVFMRRLLPMGRKGLEIKNGVVTPGDQAVANLVAANGAAARSGDRVVITNVMVNEKSIVLEINGGPKKHQKWYKHIQIGVGGIGSSGGAPRGPEATGSVVTLAFDKYVPELTGEQVRAMLAPVFDFTALTQAEAYTKTLPPVVQEAIKNHQVLVGMNKDMVIYAKGRPPHKIRDKNDKGQDYEEWIYGDPPQEVDFVRFHGDVVARLEIMTVDGEKIVRTEKEVDLKSADTEVARKKSEEKPANAPSLRRPGEEPENPQGPQTAPGSLPPYPQPDSSGPDSSPDGLPPH
jgi:hypothetical protein